MKHCRPRCSAAPLFTLALHWVLAALLSACVPQVREVGATAATFWALLVGVTALFVAVMCGDPGFITPVSLEIPTLSPPPVQDTVTEAKSRHSKQIDSITSHAGLLEKDSVRVTGPSESSLLATNPATHSPREFTTVQAADDQPKEEDLRGEFPMGEELQSQEDEAEVDNERPEAEAANPAEPIPLPVRSEEQVINVEVRFCVRCSMEQPLRARHCRTCDRCVALYDHHCPWLGICVAERNRFRFFWYLVLEATLLWYTFLIAGAEFTREPSLLKWAEKHCLLLAVEIVVGAFCLLVSALLGFHFYLAGANVTTWECILWGKIPYLKEWPRNYGSPFSRGVLWNLVGYCCKSLPPTHTVWTLPHTRPQQPPRRCFCC